MKIAILTSGILPVPAVQGGAVENLTDFYLDYNDRHKLHDITIYSIWHPNVTRHPALQSDVNHYVYISIDGWWAKLKKLIYRKKHLNGYYHYTIEYYLHQAIKFIRKRNYDIILIENRPGYALILNRLCPMPCVLHLHNDFLYPGVENVTEICNAFRRIISVSNYITNRVKAVCEDKAKCITVHNAIDVKAFQTANPIHRQSLGLTDDDFVLVFIGRLIEEKGVLQLIQAMKRIHDIPRLKLLIVGANAYGKEQYTTPFIRLLQQEAVPLQDNIIFTGFINYTDISSYLEVADVAVLPSIWQEPFGLTIVEVMAAGLPLITTRSGGIPEICAGVATIVERENIVNNLVTAITDLYEHPEKRKEMAQASLERSKLFDKDMYAKNFFCALVSFSQ